MVSPNFEMCQECPQWDDINGCWSNCIDVCCEGRLDEDGNYDDDWDSKKLKVSGAEKTGVKDG